MNYHGLLVSCIVKAYSLSEGLIFPVMYKKRNHNKNSYSLNGFNFAGLCQTKPERYLSKFLLARKRTVMLFSLNFASIKFRHFRYLGKINL